MTDRHQGTPAWSDTRVDAKAEVERNVPSDTRVDAKAVGAAAAEPEILYQEGVPPEERGSREADHPHAMEPKSKLLVHDGDAEPVADRGAPAVAGTANRRSQDLAKISQRQRKKERDARAEKMAQRVIFGIGALFTIGLFAFLSLEDVEDAGSKGGGGRTDPSTKATAVRKPPLKLSSTIDETPDLPALRSLESTGLTIAAEGLPQVISVAGQPAMALVGLETCRFAYGIWEFSPNRAFRFLTTCEALDGQILVGAYEVERAVVVMSALSADGVVFSSRFEVQKPSQIITEVETQGGSLRVVQRATAMRPGMDGAGFFSSLAGKNTLKVRGLAPAPRPRGGDQEKDQPPPPGAGEAQKPTGKDPLLDLLKGGS